MLQAPTLLAIGRKGTRHRYLPSLMSGSLWLTRLPQGLACSLTVSSSCFCALKSFENFGVFAYESMVAARLASSQKVWSDSWLLLLTSSDQNYCMRLPEISNFPLSCLTWLVPHLVAIKSQVFWNVCLQERSLLLSSRWHSVLNWTCLRSARLALILKAWVIAESWLGRSLAVYV